MLLSRLRHDQRGTTLVELLVGMMTGMVVLFGLTTLIVVTLNTTSRVSARVDATQRARLGLERVIQQLHSACILPKAAPIRVGSKSDELKFVHASGSSVEPEPVLSKIRYKDNALIQSDFEWIEGTYPPFWAFNEDEDEAIRTVQLMDGIAPILNRPVFSYYGYANGAVSTTPFSVPLSETDASRTIRVNVAFTASPRSGKSDDATPARIQGGASLRLTAPSYNAAAPSMPCQ